MKTSEEQLLPILKIDHDTSMRGEGISLKDALKRTRYSDLWPSFVQKDLEKTIKCHPEFILQWIMFSEDKRTSGGWHLSEPGVIGNLDGISDLFDSIEEATAE